MTLTFDLDWTRIPMQRLSRAVLRKPPRYWIAAGLIWLVLCALAFTALRNPRFTELIELYAPGFVFACLAYLAFIAVQLLRQPFNRAQRAAPMRQRPSRLTLSAQGITMGNTLFEARYAWPAVIGTRQTEGYLILLIGPREYVPVPLDQLPAGVTPADLGARIAAWSHA